MLAIRMQRTGRKGHAMFRVIAQDSRFSPTSGRVAEQLGHYDPHAKTVTIDKEAIAKHLANGAQPSPRVARLLKSEGIKLPSWVAVADKKSGTVKNVDKLRSTRPAVEEVAAEAPAEEVAPVEEVAPETTEAAEVPAEVVEPEAPAEEAAVEEPAEK